MNFRLSALRPIFGLAVAALLIAGFAFLPAGHAQAQGQSLAFIRDTEAERVLRSKLDPILLAAGLVPQDVHLYIVNDSSINAFAASGPVGGADEHAESSINSAKTIANIRPP